MNSDKSLFFVSLPKSGTLFTWYSLSGVTGLAVPDFPALEGWGEYSTGKDFSCPDLYACGDYNTQLLRPENMAKFSHGYVFGGHMQASYHNIRVLEESGINKISVLLRDPRDALVSWVHHLAKLGPAGRNYHSKIYFMPPDYYDWPLIEQFRFQVRNFLPVISNWIEGWLSYYASPDRRVDVLILLYDELKVHPERYIRRLTDHFGVTDVDMSKIVVPEPGKMHFRKGTHGEWREDFAPEDHELVANLLGDRIGRRFRAAAETHPRMAEAKAALNEGRAAAARAALGVLTEFPNHRPAFDLFVDAAGLAGKDTGPLRALAERTFSRGDALEEWFFYRYDLVDGCAATIGIG